jgi:protein O-GlcNAc transferase
MTFETDARAAQLARLALVELDRARPQAAARLLERAISLSPSDPELRIAVAQALIAAGDLVAARQQLAVARSLAPQRADGWLLSGVVADRLGDRRTALQEYVTAVRQAPQFVPALVAAGNALAEAGEVARARAAFADVTRLDPGNAMGWLSLGLLDLQMDRHGAARDSLRRALASDGAALPSPGRVAAECGLLDCALHLADWSDLEDYKRAVVANTTRGAPVGMGSLLAVSDDPSVLRRAAEAHAADLTNAQPISWVGPSERRDARMRIAYVSADLNQHPVSALAVGVFENHDASRFDCAAFSLRPGDGSELRTRVERAFPTFVDAEGLPESEIADRIAAFGADVCVDLSGLTAGARPGVLARRPAPVRVGFLGYPGAMGARLVDYTVVDRHVVPSGSENGFGEALAFLPHCYLPVSEDPPGGSIEGNRSALRRESGLPEGAFVYCCFNHPGKITPDTFDAWMTILRAVPSAVLWLSVAKPEVQAALRSEAERRGVGGGRLVWARHESRREDHLARLRCADVFLDTFPYNAHATAVDALVAGVPLLTLGGRALHSRVAGSLLVNSGLAELATHSRRDYVELAIRLALADEPFRTLRTRASALRGSGTLFDVAGSCRALEAAFTHMVSTYRAGRAPGSFEIRQTKSGFAAIDCAKETVPD